MYRPSHLPTAPPVFIILNTKQFDQWYTFFVHGLKALEDQVKYEHQGGPFSQAKVSALTKVLLNIARALILFLSNAASLQSPGASPGLKEFPHLENIWIRAAIADLRLHCHRYSWCASQIANILEKRASSRAKVQVAQADLGRIVTKGGLRRLEAKINRKSAITNSDTWTNQTENGTAGDRSNEPTYLRPSPPASPSVSTRTSTSIRSGWSLQPLISPIDSVSTLDSDSNDAVGDERDNAFLCTGNATVYGDAITAGWSPLSDSSDEYPSHW